MALSCWYCGRVDEMSHGLAMVQCLHCGEFTAYGGGPFEGDDTNTAPAHRPASTEQIAQGYA